MIKAWQWLAVASALTGSGALAQESGFTLRATEVKARPFLDAEGIGKLPEKAPVSILGRQGGWSQIHAGQMEGWVRMLSLRLGNPDPLRNKTAMATTIGFGRRAPGTGPTVTTGVRGFSEEDLKAAKPNPEELKRMESFAVPPAGAAQFAAAGKLDAQTVPFVDADGKVLKVKK
ncbi:MAG: SH3 domain-containing protein [Betaproteobacteria bacterium]